MEKYLRRQLASRLLYFIITGRTKELLEQEVKPLVEEHLKERGLELSQEKTKLTHIREGFDFLGQNVRKYKDGKLIIKPSKKNVETFFTKVREIIDTNKQARAGNLIVQLNPVIRGWANYHRHVVSKKVYDHVDAAIYEKLWQWSARRHPQKSAAWVAKKYFTNAGTDNWVFHGEAIERNGTTKQVRLLKARRCPSNGTPKSKERLTLMRRNGRLTLNVV